MSISQADSRVSRRINSLDFESSKRFDDGGHFRIEIPSVEGPEMLRIALETADDLGVPIHRVSQGSGIALLSDSEITEMVELCAERNIELCLFLGPRGTWDIGAATRTPSAGSGPRVRGADQVAYSLEDAERACRLGVRCILVADEGVLWALHSLRVSGELPTDLKLKMSTLAGPTNPASFAVVERLGADSINVPGDLPISDIASMREVSEVPIDLYIESPDALGGYVRQHEAPQFIARIAPVYLKFGLRNAPEMYPTGGHLRDLNITTTRERVHRAFLLISHLEQLGLMKYMSPTSSKPGTIELHRFSE